MADFKTRFQHIGLMAKPDEPRIRPVLATLRNFLLAKKVDVLLDLHAAEILALAAERQPTEQLAKNCDLIIVVGGDGSLLNAARLMVDADIPLAGVNLGRLGFLVDISPDHMLDTLDQILDGCYLEDQRFLLQARIGDQKPQLALNDVVLHKWNIARMIEFETWVDGHLVDSQRSDGLILSTPTGSTAYALSGGGPLLEPGLDAIAMVPICPHHLSNRPIVIHGDSKITIATSARTHPEHVRVTCDGQVSLRLQPEDRLIVRKYPRKLRLIHPQGHDHFNLLRAKLGWGGRHP